MAIFSKIAMDPTGNNEVGMYSIYDLVAEVFTPPFFCASDALAVRQYKRALGEDPFMSDYRLYEIARYNAKEAIVVSNKHREVPVG